MICKNCNAEIDENAVQCPFCGAPTTVNVDPNAAPAQDYSQPSYGQPSPPPVTPTVDPAQYEPNLTNGKDIEKEANTVWILGIVGLIVSIVIGLCCCAIPGPIISGIGFFKARGLEGSVGLLSQEGQNKLKNGRLMCIIALIISAVGIIANIVLMATGALSSILENS